MAFPKWFYEGLGTAVFVVTSSLAYAQADGATEQAFYYGAIFALCHYAFGENSGEGLFNPALSVGKYIIKGSGDLAGLFSIVIGQLLGAWIGIMFGAQLNDEFAVQVMEAAADASFAQSFIRHAVFVAVFVILFFSFDRNGHGMTMTIYMIFIFFLIVGFNGFVPNVAVHFGQMSIANMNANDMVAVFGGFVGAFLGGLFYNHWGQVEEK